MVCALVLRGDATGGQQTFVDALKALLDRDGYVWRGVYDDRRFDRHARGIVRKRLKMGGERGLGEPQALLVTGRAARRALAALVENGPAASGCCRS